MSTTTYTVTMAELKEPAHNSIWSNYGSPVHMSTGRFNHALDPGLADPSAASQHPGRPRADQHAYPYARYSQEEADAYDRHAHPGLAAHHSYPSLKRPFSHIEQPPSYTELVQDMRDEGSKLGVNNDHKLLSFRRVQDKHTIVDQHGRVQALELSAQLHGMFFLSEVPASASDGTLLQAELTCYRRNLFQISGNLVTPRGQLSVVTETGETLPVSSTEVTISADESVDGHPVRLIVIPYKTPPPNSPEVSQNPDQEPPALPLIPFQDDGAEGTSGEYAVYPIGWRRLQFRIATANNGRRKELQQHFVLHLKVIGTLSNGSRVVMSESITAPIVVRGRSPRNFQARKEIPLLGSSAASRGQALVETGLGIVAGPLTIKPQDKAKALSLEVPRGVFTFSAGPNIPPSPMTMRSNSYPTWNSTQMPMAAPGNGNYPPPTTTISAEPYQKMPISGTANFKAEPQELPLPPQTSMPSVQLSLVANEQQQQQQQAPIRAQYAYAHGTSAPSQLSMSPTTDNNLSVPRYVDSNPRPSKSSRHANHQSVHSSSSITNNDTSNEYRYGPPYVGLNSNSGEISPHDQGQTGYASGPGPSPQDATASNPSSAATASGAQNPPRDYFPPTASWTTTAGETNAPTYSNGEAARSYSLPDQYSKRNDQQQAPPSSVYPPARGSFDAINHYSWNAT